MIELMKLPYAEDALEPIISKETVGLHYGKHHKGYVDNLNKLIEGTTFEDMSLEDIVRESFSAFKNNQTCEGRGDPIFNNAAQVYNHNLYWNSLRPKGEKISDAARSYIEKYYGSVDRLKQTVTAAASKFFGSGWIWICKHEDNSPFVQPTHDAGTPIIDPLTTPLLVIDLWEHGYYVDYKNDRAKYVDQVWTLLNLDVLA
jgi:Fe-Mn family superoxide dismutase